MFLHISTGFPGSMHDSRVLKSSSLFHEAEKENILSNPNDVIERTKVGPVLSGDGGYPLNKCLIKPYTFSAKEFNEALSSARVIVERAFGVSKARWRCLLKQLDNRVENVSNVIITFLHCITFYN